MNRIGLAVACMLFFLTPLDAAMTKAEAKKLIAEYELPETGEGLIAVLNAGIEDAPAVVEAFLTLGVRADREATYLADGGVTLTRYPLNYLLDFWCGGEPTAPMAKLLLDAGADPNTRNPENEWTPLMQAYACPDVIRVLLAKKPDLGIIDRNGNTVMHYVVRIGGDRQLESIRLLIDAGFDLERWRKELLVIAKDNPEVKAFLQGTTPKSASGTGATRPGTTDWTSLPPYPQWSKSEATKLLARPGADTTVDDHMWDGITRREPMRLAAALGAGADVRQLRPVTGLTPLVLLTERCDAKDAGIQTANAEMLIAGGAALTGVDANGENALMLAADDCPIGVVHALLRAGVSPHSRSQKGATALRNAIDDGRADVVAALLDAGVDPRKEPYNVRALASGKPEIEALLKKRRK